MKTVIYISDDLLINVNLINLLNVQLKPFIVTPQPDYITRMGFLWANSKSKIPFGKVKYIDKTNNQPIIFHYFSNELIQMLKNINTTVTIDFITSDLNTPLFLYEINQVKILFPQITFNYCTSNINENWILTTSGENLLPIYFKENINPNSIPSLKYVDFFSTHFILSDDKSKYTLASDLVIDQDSNLIWVSNDIYNFYFPIDISDTTVQTIDFDEKNLTLNSYGEELFDGLFINGPTTNLTISNAEISLNGSIGQYCGILWSNYTNTPCLNLTLINCEILIHGSINEYGGGLIGSFAGSNGGSISITNSFAVINNCIKKESGGLIGTYCALNGSIYVSNSYTIIG